MNKQDRMVTIKAYQTKCRFCGEIFTEFKPHLAEDKCDWHMRNDCKVLRCIAIAKDAEYPIAP